MFVRKLIFLHLQKDIFQVLTGATLLQPDPKLTKLKWAQLELISSICIKAVVLRSWSKCEQKMDFAHKTLQAYNSWMNWANDLNLGSFYKTELFNMSPSWGQLPNSFGSDSLSKFFHQNKWRGVTILLLMGGQGHPTPSLTPRPPLHTHTWKSI